MGSRSGGRRLEDQARESLGGVGHREGARLLAHPRQGRPVGQEACDDLQQPLRGQGDLREQRGPSRGLDEARVGGLLVSAGARQRDVEGRAPQLAANLAAYLRRERPFNPGLSASKVPPDAVQTTASGVDPHISADNASIQARRVAEERGLELARVRELIDQSTDGRGLGLLGEPGVNVLELNLALDREDA